MSYLKIITFPLREKENRPKNGITDFGFVFGVGIGLGSAFRFVS